MIVSLFVVIAIAASGFAVAAAVVYAPSDDQTMTFAIISHILQKKTPQSSVVYNMHLSIPSIALTAKVQEVGVTKKGNVGTPNNFTDVAWYDGSSEPGSVGTSIIDGHIDNGLAFPAIFSNLKNVKTGDDIYVDTKDGNHIHFIVRAIDTYNFNQPTNTIFAASNTPTLKLITCAGVYNPLYKTHDKRLVVTAEKAEI